MHCMFLVPLYKISETYVVKIRNCIYIVMVLFVITKMYEDIFTALVLAAKLFTAS